MKRSYEFLGLMVFLALAGLLYYGFHLSDQFEYERGKRDGIAEIGALETIQQKLMTARANQGYQSGRVVELACIVRGELCGLRDIPFSLAEPVIQQYMANHPEVSK